MSDDNLVDFPTRHINFRQSTPKKRSSVLGPLKAAREAKLLDVLVIGLNKDGKIFATSSLGHDADMLLLLTRFKALVMREYNNDDFSDPV